VLCTGWGAREALVQGPLKIIGGLFLLPFAASVIAAQLWLRTVAFIVWLAMACPCCRLQRADNVYDAFERELAVPLLQCSFLAFACMLAAIVQVSGQLSGMQRTAVGLAAAYYTGMLMLWTAPTVLRAKVANEENFDASMALGDEGNTTLLQRERSQRLEGESDIELEDLRSTCDELRALLQRERHDHSVEAGQLQERLRDQECQNRTVEREHAQAKEASARLLQEVDGWRERCSELKRQLALHQPRPELPRLSFPPAPDGAAVPAQGRPDHSQALGADGVSGTHNSSEETSGRADSEDGNGSSGRSSSANGAGANCGGREAALADGIVVQGSVGEEGSPDRGSGAPLVDCALPAGGVTPLSPSCGAPPGPEQGMGSRVEDMEEDEQCRKSDTLGYGPVRVDCAASEAAEVPDEMPAAVELPSEADPEIKAAGEAAADAAPVPTSPQLVTTPDGCLVASAGFATPPESASDGHSSPRCGNEAGTEGVQTAG